MLKTSTVVLALLFRLLCHCVYTYGGYLFVLQFRDAFVHTAAPRAVLSPLYLALLSEERHLRFTYARKLATHDMIHPDYPFILIWRLVVNCLR